MIKKKKVNGLLHCIVYAIKTIEPADVLYIDYGNDFDQSEFVQINACTKFSYLESLQNYYNIAKFNWRFI